MQHTTAEPDDLPSVRIEADPRRRGAAPVLRVRDEDLNPSELRPEGLAAADPAPPTAGLSGSLDRVLLAAALGLGGLLILTQWGLWQPQGSLGQYTEMRAAVARQQAENDRLRYRNQALAAEVLDLKQGLEAVEELARSEMGLTKRDETFFQVLSAEPTRRGPP